MVFENKEMHLVLSHFTEIIPICIVLMPGCSKKTDAEEEQHKARYECQDLDNQMMKADCYIAQIQQEEKGRSGCCDNRLLYSLLKVVREIDSPEIRSREFYLGMVIERLECLGAKERILAIVDELKIHNTDLSQNKILLATAYTKQFMLITDECKKHSWTDASGVSLEKKVRDIKNSVMKLDPQRGDILNMLLECVLNLSDFESAKDIVNIIKDESAKNHAIEQMRRATGDTGPKMLHPPPQRLDLNPHVPSRR